MKIFIMAYTLNIGIRMKRKELTNTFYDDFKLKKPFGLHGFYKNISASKELPQNTFKMINQARIFFADFADIAYLKK